MEQMSNFNTKFLAAWLNISGIALPGQKHAKYVNILKYYLVYAFILMTSAQVVLFRRPSTLVEMSIAVVFFNSGLFLNSTTLILHFKKKYIINIIQSMKFDFIQPFTVFSVGPTTQKFKKLFFNAGLPGVCLYVFSTCGTVLLFPFSDKSYDDINALFVPGAFPWTIDTRAKYLLTLALEFSWLSVLSAPVFLNFMFGFYYIFEIQIQYEILCKMVENFNCSNKWISMAGSVDEVREHKMVQSFNNCIRRHQNILKFSKNFNACYNTIFTVNLFYSVPSLALILLSIVEEKSITTIARNVMTLTIIMIHLLLYTSIGQVLQNSNERFRNALSDVQWFSNKSIKFRKIFLIVLTNTQRVRCLQASNTYAASYELFFNIIKMSYTYYNVIDQAFRH